MSLIDIGIGLSVGFVIGVGAMLFYLRWKMKKQLGSIEEQMGAVADLGEEMSEMMDPVEEGEIDMDEVGKGEMDLDTDEN